MPPEVEAELRAYWSDPEALNAAERRHYEAERELRLSLHPNGDKPAEWIITEIRSGAWERRQKRNMQALLHDRAKLSQWKREGYTFDEQHRLVAPALARIAAPRRQATTSPQRRARATTRTGSSRDGPSSESEPPLAPRRCLTAAERRVLKLLVDTRRREIIAAGVQLTQADRALFADDGAEQQGVR